MNHDNDALPLVSLALDWLVPGQGEERYTFHPAAQEALELGLAALFESRVPARSALEPLLGLAYTLEMTHKSPTAARLIVELIGGSPAALDALGLHSGANLRFRGEKFLHGRNRALAPSFDEKAPENAVSVRDLAPFPRHFGGARTHKQPNEN